MAETIVLETQTRELDGSRGAARLRAKGLVPAVVYGHEIENAHIALPKLELQKAIMHGIHVLDLKTDGKAQKALIKEVQWDHLGMEVLHVDFARISETERVHVNVPIELRGTAPGIAAGGVLDQPMHGIEIECLAIAIPATIRVNVGELQIGSAIHVKDLTLPEGVKALADPDALVVHVTTKQEEEAAPAVAGEGAAEPEVIGRKPDEEEEAE